MGQYLGYVALGAEIRGTIVTRDGSDTPKDATGAPSFRVYGPLGIMANGTGSLTIKDPAAAGGAITGASNASPIVITSTGHNLNTGTRVTIAGVGGNTAANGDFTVTRVDSNTFSLNGSTGNAAYTSGGTWHASGVYDFAITPIGGDGYDEGITYTVVVTAVVSGTTKSQVATFTVV